MAAARRSARGARDSRRSTASGRSSSRSGSSRRGERDDDDPRSSSRRSARGSARGGPSKDTTVIIGGVVAAVVILGFGVFAFSGKRKIVRNKERAPVPVATRVATMDFFNEGMSRGYDWKSRMKNRRTPFTEEEVREVAERMTSDYVRKGIDAEGEKRFVNGFVRAALGR